MSYAPYPVMKDNKIPWLGSIPAEWDVKALRYIAKPIIGLTYSPTDVVGENEGTLVLRASNIQNGKISLHDNVFVAANIPDKLRIKAGDILVCSRNGSRHLIGKNALILEDHDEWSFGAFTTVIRSEYGPFLYWVMNSRMFEYQSGRFLTTTINQLTTGVLNSFEIPFPSVEEQTAIADFLNKKTAEIDDLIAKKEELLRLLAEQRTALITHSVTKGLDPNAPMKPSGIDWLGDVPEGWQVKPFKREVWYQEGPGIMAVDFRDEGVPLLRIRNLKPGKVELEGCNFLDHDMANGKWEHFQVEEGDRLISTSASTGLVSVVDADAVGAIPYTGIIRIRPLSDSLLPEFLEYFVSSGLFFDQIELLATGTTIQHFGPYHLNQMVMVVPPIVEQRELIRTLTTDLSKIAATAERVETALQKLKEYRTALITNAVTGKIKVA